MWYVYLLPQVQIRDVVSRVSRAPRVPLSPSVRLSVRLHVRVRVHAYKSLAFAFSPYQAIRIFYFNLITPNGFKLLLSLSLSLPFSLSLFVSASVLRCALAFVTLQVWFLLLISICPHIVTPRLDASYPLARPGPPGWNAGILVAVPSPSPPI